MKVTILIALLLSLPAPLRSQERKDDGKAALTLLNVSYDPTRELYKQIGDRFARKQLAETGRVVAVNSSHGGSGAQTRAVLGGLKADVVTLALSQDVDTLADKGLLRPDWASRFPNNSSPYTSTIIFVVRKGNPKRVKGWDDLVREDVSFVTPSPKTGGASRLVFLAAWGHVTLNGGTEAQATDFIKRFYQRVPVLDTGSRGSATTFLQKNIGDVLVTWENEGLLASRELGKEVIELVYPADTILAEPPVAVVDKNVDTNGTRGAAEAFLAYLYTEEAQEIVAAAGYRPSNPEVLGRHPETFPKIGRLYTVKEVAGSWRDAQKKFFADGAVFDQIYLTR
ncbi:MAG TPA: sulfate ABC transporter substrate-binding protein [Planctomycetota bacterium]|nr:sulfate ABC transporter substrate-binding protein [Planctomycetota bacterium]